MSGYGKLRSFAEAREPDHVFIREGFTYGDARAVLAEREQEELRFLRRIGHVEGQRSEAMAVVVQFTKVLLENSRLREMLLEFCDKGHSIEREDRARALLGGFQWPSAEEAGTYDLQAGGKFPPDEK